MSDTLAEMTDTNLKETEITEEKMNYSENYEKSRKSKKCNGKF